MFKIIQKSKKSSARLGELKTRNGVIKTPFFMIIGSKGSVKSLTSEDIKNLGAQIVLANAYHLYLQPGLKILKKFKGLHNFMNWHGPILTDSGGYQVFSLSAKTRQGKSLRKVSKQGVKFQSFLDGSQHLFTPEKVQDIQDVLGSDIKMVLDVCSPYPCSKKQAEKDLELTHMWAEKSLDYHKKSCSKNLLFGIVQGSTFKDLRIQSARTLLEIEKNFSAQGGPASGWDGLAIGGLAVGESNQTMYDVLDYTLPELPENKPRYLMGVGKPENIVECVKQGIDMFDCVIPTREARHGRLYVFLSCPDRVPIKSERAEGPRGIKLSGKFYKIININNSKYKNSTQKLDKNCECELCKNYTLGYLHHLFKAQEPLALRLATLHNVKFYLDLMHILRQAIDKNSL